LLPQNQPSNSNKGKIFITAPKAISTLPATQIYKQANKQYETEIQIGMMKNPKS
jgi:hypothetical protein